MPTTPPDRTQGCEKCGHPHPRCRAHNSSGQPCGRHPVTGLNVCRTHGGASPRSKGAAARRTEEQAAARELARLGQAISIHPAEALLDLVHWTAGEVAYWRAVVVELEHQGGHGALTWGTTTETHKGSGEFPGTDTTDEAAPHVAYRMLTDASNRLAAYSSAALKAGVDERKIQLAERQGDLIATMQRAILDRMLAAVLELLRAHGVTDDKIIAALQQGWAEAMGVVVPEELRRLMGGEGE